MPTTEQPAAIPFAVGQATTTPEPEPRYIAGGTVLPTTAPGTGGDLLALCDPWLAAALPYLQHCLNRALASLYRAAMAGQALASDSACVETLPLDPALYLHTRALRLPLLCMHPVSATFAERTLQHERMTVRYRLDYLLNAITHEQAARIVPVLQAAASVLMQAVRRAGSASYQGGADIWQATGVEAVRVESATFGAFDRGDLAQMHPALSLLIDVVWRTADDAAAGLPLWGASLTAETDPDGNPFTVATGRTDLP